MSIQIQGNGGVVADVGGTGFRALKVQSMPIEYGSLGHYRKALLSGTMAAGLAGAAAIWSLRWTDSTRVAVVQRVSLDGFGVATGFTAGFWDFRLMFARSFTAADSGGTTGTLSGSNGKTRTSMGTTLMAAIQMSTTAILTVGTRTLDTDAIGIMSGSIGTGGTAQILAVPAPLLDAAHGTHHPVVLAANEGLVIQATVPATGTWQAGVSCVWAEVASY